MKKKLEAELISIAHRILQIKDKSSLAQLQEEARQLYEKLTILQFSESHFEGPQPTIGQIRSVLETEIQKEAEIEGETPTEVVSQTESEVETSVETKIQKEAEVKQEEVETIVENNNEAEVKTLIENQIQEEELEDIVESNSEVLTQTEKEVEVEVETSIEIEEEKEVIPQTEEILEHVLPIENKPVLVIEEVNARVTEDLFVPANSTLGDNNPTLFKNEEQNEEKTTSLNDLLKKEIHIGLNDRLSYIKYLFDGSAADYNRVLSQLETMSSRKEVMDFMTTMVKPDYNDWIGKEEYEERFMDTVLGKFDS